MLNPLEVLEKRLTKLNRKHLSIGAFSSLSLGALTIHPALISSVLLMPFMIGGLVDYLYLKKDNKTGLSGIFEKQYHKIITNWLEDYVNNSETLTEKKYKLIFFSIYLQSKGIILEHYYNPEHFLVRVSSELMSETKFEIINIFNPIYNGNLNNFVKDDDHTQIEIAKKVAKDFEDVGLLGHIIFPYIISDSSLFLLKFQNYVLTLNDKTVLEKKTNDFLKKNNTMKYTGILLEDIDEIILPIVNNEDNEISLDLYQKFFPLLFYEKKAKNYVQEIINKKLQYLKLDQELNNKLINKITTKTQKAHKI